MVGRETSGVRILVWPLKRAENEHPGHSERLPGLMTFEALIVTLEPGLVSRRLLEGVEIRNSSGGVYFLHLYFCH